MKIVLLIPTLNEEEGLRKIFEELPKGIGVLIVDSCSKDKTLKIAQKNDADIVIEPSLGYGYAMQSGFKRLLEYPDDTVVITMDADGSYDVSDIENIIKPIQDGNADVVNGNRLDFQDEGSMGFKQRFGNRLLSKIANVCLGLNVDDCQSGMKAFKVALIKKIDVKTNGINWPSEFLWQAKRKGARIIELPITYHKRIGQKKLGRFVDGWNELVTISWNSVFARVLRG